MKLKDKILAKYKKMFECDTVRISKPIEKMFLIIGFKKHTKDSLYGWYDKTGKRKDFEYIEEKAIASGYGYVQLKESALEYKRLCGITMIDYLKERCA